MIDLVFTLSAFHPEATVYLVQLKGQLIVLYERWGWRAIDIPISINDQTIGLNFVIIYLPMMGFQFHFKYI